MKLPHIDHARTFDWGKTSQDYAAYRTGYPEAFYEVLAALGIGKLGQRVLDLGTGPGVLARAFAKRGAVVTGVDMAANQIAAARRRPLEAIAPDTFTVLHQMTIHIYMRTGAIATVNTSERMPPSEQLPGWGGLRGESAGHCGEALPSSCVALHEGL